MYVSSPLNGQELEKLNSNILINRLVLMLANILTGLEINSIYRRYQKDLK